MFISEYAYPSMPQDKQYCLDCGLGLTDKETEFYEFYCKSCHEVREKQEQCPKCHKFFTPTELDENGDMCKSCRDRYEDDSED